MVRRDRHRSVRNGQSTRSRAPDGTQLIRIQPYSAAGRTLIDHDRLLGAETSSHHDDIRISGASQSRRRADQSAVSGHQLVEQKISEQFVRIVYPAQLEAIKPYACAAPTDVRLEGPGSNGRETLSASWALHRLATLPRVE